MLHLEIGRLICICFAFVFGQRCFAFVILETCRALRPA